LELAVALAAAQKGRTPTWRSVILGLSIPGPYRGRRQPSSEIVSANHAPEDAELADALDEMGNGEGRPNIYSLLSIAATQRGATLEWLLDWRRRRSIPYRLQRCGYIACRNPDAVNGLWVINGRRQTLYAKVSLRPKERLQAALDYVVQQTKTAGNGWFKRKICNYEADHSKQWKQWSA
jgi:hypothetical protein